MTKRRNPIRLALAVVAILCGAFAERSGAQTGAFCTQTADALLDACKASVIDDGAVGTAVCINMTDPKAQKTCLDDLEYSKEIKLDEFRKRGRIERMKESACYSLWRIL